MKSHLPFKSFSNRARWVVHPTPVLALLTFFTFVAVSQYLWGDALNGYLQTGKYFVCALGSCVQVSPEIWQYSYWHAVTAMGGIQFSIAEVALFANTGDITNDWNAP